MAWRFATRIGAIHANRCAEKPYFHHVRAIRANRLQPAIRNFQYSETQFAKNGFNPGARDDARESGDSRSSANGFERIGPSKPHKQETFRDTFGLQTCHCNSLVGRGMQGRKWKEKVVFETIFAPRINSFNGEELGRSFGPDQKKIAPPPSTLQTRACTPATRLLGNPPPPLYFEWKNQTPATCPDAVLPFPAPEPKIKLNAATDSQTPKPRNDSKRLSGIDRKVTHKWLKSVTNAPIVVQEWLFESLLSHFLVDPSGVSSQKAHHKTVRGDERLEKVPPP